MIALKEVTNSSAITGYGYEPVSRVLAVRFNSGKVTHYKDVPPATAEAFDKADSKGRAVGLLLRGTFDFEDAAKAEERERSKEHAVETEGGSAD